LAATNSRHEDADYLDPEIEPAKIPPFFIHPQHARKGIERAILAAAKAEAKAAGFKSLELMSYAALV